MKFLLQFLVINSVFLFSLQYLSLDFVSSVKNEGKGTEVVIHRLTGNRWLMNWRERSVVKRVDVLFFQFGLLQLQGEESAF